MIQRIKQAQTAGLEISAPDAILDQLVIETYGDALFIEVPEHLSGEVRVVVTTPSVREIVSSGGAAVVGSGLLSEELSLEARGTGSFNFSALQADELLVTGSDGAAFTLSGSVNRQVLDLADHDLYQAVSLHSQTVEATVVGSGYILVAVDELLDVRLAGAANVRYLGSPFVSKNVSGTGSIAPVTGNSI